MTISETVIVGGKALGALGAIAKSSPSIMRLVKRSYHRMTKGYVRIPIFGSGGVGKSTAARIIAGAAPDSAYGAYEESLWTEIVPLSGDIPGELRVAPGQESRVDRHWPELFKDLSSGKARGLINVVSYGYHALEIQSVEDSSVWRPDMSLVDFRNAYTEARRKLEITLLEELVSGLSATTSHIWMATIINKQDLWNTEYGKVKDHYNKGQYADIIARTTSKLGSKNFQHEYIPTSLAISNLTTASGQVVAKTTEGFDVNSRNESLRKLSQKLNLLVSQ